MRWSILSVLLVVVSPLYLTGQGAQSCYRLTSSEDSVSVEEIVDPLPFAEAARTFLENTPPSGSSLLLTVRYAASGAPQSVSSYSNDGAFPESHGLQTVLLPYLRVQPARGTESYHSLIVRVDGEPAVTVARFQQQCPPMLVNRQEIARLAAQAYSRVRSSTRATIRTSTAQLNVKVNPAGLPEEIRLQRSTGFGGLDVEARRIAEQMHFVPGKLDEYVVTTWVLVPLTFGGR